MVTTPNQARSAALLTEGMRPINLRTDLAPLADLIELVFADTMDSNGRAALREMRYLSKLGVSLPLVSRVNELAMGISLGYVWVAQGRLVGNVSIYAADWPRDLGPTWIIANVGVHPEYQRQGIARRLMEASLGMIRKRHGARAILQVDVNNHAARALYRSMGFVEERAFTTWRRVGASRVPEPARPDLHITRRGRTTWKEEMALARQVRPMEQGGLGWLRPLHPGVFRPPLTRQFSDWLNLRSTERLVIRDEDGAVGATLWITSAVATRTRLTLMCAPQHRGTFDDALLNTAVKRFGRTPMVIEHPADDEATSSLLTGYRFVSQRTLVHARWEP